jgi:hypothetical protein
VLAVDVAYEIVSMIRSGIPCFSSTGIRLPSVSPSESSCSSASSALEQAGADGVFSRRFLTRLTRAGVYCFRFFGYFGIISFFRFLSYFLFKLHL